MHRQHTGEAALIAELARIMASSTSPLGALLDLTLSCVGANPQATGAAVLKLDVKTRSWSLLLSTPGFDPAGSGEGPVAQSVTDSVAELVAELSELLLPSSTPAGLGDVPESGWDQPLPVEGGRSSAMRLCGGGRLLGALVVRCVPARWSAVPYAVSTGLTMCVTGAVIRDTAVADSSSVQRSARAIQRLFEEGANARDVEEAGTVLARVAAQAFQTERAGMYVVDVNGVISFAVGVGVSPELSDALATSLVGKVAAESPVWQTLERKGGPSLIDDVRHSAVRPGGFVQTLSLLSYAAIPLLSTAGPLGMVICGDCSHLRTWTERDHQLATQFALEGALIVDAARLRASERAQLAHTTHQAFHDALTGIPNRNLLMDRLERALASAAERDANVAMLLLDLDDFKQVNDTLGHRYGDDLLREVAGRLNRSLRGSDTLARLGGDEFAILISDDSGIEQARATAARVHALLSAPVDLGGISLNAVASIGIALFPEHAMTSADLLQRADIAMYAAKRAGSGTMIYRPQQHDSTVDKLKLYTELRHAISEGELVLAYQPKLDLHRNEITGVEALVRWRHPRRGVLGPGAFLPMAESTGLIRSLTAWVVQDALRQWTAWRAAGVTLDLAVNISVRNLLDRQLWTRIADLVRTSKAGGHLILEVTETAVMVSPKECAAALTAIRALGVRISMDDFGTGYSSLALLAQLPVDELKVDQLLVRDVESNEANRAMVGAVVGVGHRLGLTVVAEGIESVQTLQMVRSLGCDEGQGYFVSRPVSPDEVIKLLQ